jgi:hypothetical protein
MDRVATLVPLIVGNGAIAMTILIHGSGVAATLRLDAIRGPASPSR